MKHIVPVYVVAAGSFLISMIGFWLDTPGSDHRGVTYAATFCMIGITAGLIATALRTQQKRIETLELLLSSKH